MEQQQLAALAEIAAIIGQDLVPERVLERILEQSCDLLEVPVGLFTLDDGDPDELAVVAARGVPAELIGRFPKGYGITSQILGHGQTVSVPDYQAYERAVPAFATQGYRALIGTPVRGAEQVLGCLILTTTDPFRQFTAEEQRFLELLSRHAGIALDHARLYAQARQREQEQTLLAEVSQRLSASLNLDGVLPEVARRVAVALGAGGVALALPTPTHDELTIGAYYAADRFSEPAPAPLLRALRIRPGVGIVGQAFATGDVQIVADYQVDVRAVPELAQHLATLHAVLAVPLRVREQTLGVLICGRLGRRDPFGPREIRLASALAERIAGAVANAQLHQAVARAAEELRQSEVRHRAVVEQAYDAIVTTSPDGLIQAFNQAAERLFGYAATDVIGQPISLLLPDRFLEEQRIGGRPESLPARPLETAGRRRSGVVFPLELTISEVRTDREWFYTWIMRSISERRALAEQLERARQTEIEERALRQSEERFRLLVQHATDLILLLDAEQLICYQSPSSRALLGYAPEALLGQPLTRYAHPDEVAAIERLLAQALAAPGQPLALELRLRHADGAWRQCEAVCQNLLDQPGIASLVLNVRDISERKRLEGQLVHQAFHDGLTHLPNRALFVDRLAHALVRATRRSQGIGLLALDLDQFKVINESLGHQAGDQVLVAMGQILQACVSPEDTVARLSGDQFVVLREEDGDIRALIALADTIAARLRAPLVVEGQEVVITASVGIVLHTTAEARAEDLLRDVELALYEAKRQGKARYAVFDPEMAARANARLRLETELRRALHHDELRVFYQPILELKSGRLSGLEALVRWQHPQRGLIPPASSSRWPRRRG